MSGITQYEAIIIGAGQGGIPLARALAHAGRKTALIERDQVGGTCVNRGCTPTKTMVASARVAYLTRRAADYGVQAGPLTVDMPRVRQRKRDLVESFRSGNQQRLEQTQNLDLLFGEARFVGPKLLEVCLKSGETLALTAPTMVIDTGTRPTTPPISGLEQVSYLDSTSIMELDVVPDHLIILGGGYIGLEFGQMFRRFGSRVTIVQRGPQLLPQEDFDVAEALTDILREDGIEVLLSTQAKAVRSLDGTIEVTVSNPTEEQNLSGSHLLVAAGRAPNTERLNLSMTGIAVNNHCFIPVSAALETTVVGVYAIGDVNGGPAFTHISYDDFRILQRRLLNGEEATTEGRLLPYTLFTDPQLGRVGLSEQAARQQGRKVRVAKMPMSSVARALEMDEARGLMKAVVDAETDKILGCAILGIEGGEMMAVLEVAMMGGLPYTALRDGIFAHLTLSEAFNNLFASFQV